MKLTRVEKIYLYLLMIIFAGIVVHAPLTVVLETLLPKYSLLIKSWKEIIMVISLGLMIYIVSRHGMWKDLWNEWILRLIAFFGLLHVILLGVMYQGLAAAAAGMAIDLRYFLYFVLVYVAMRIAPSWRGRMVKIGIIGAAVVVGFATIQLFLPKDVLAYIGYNKNTIIPYLTVDKNPHFIRENSTLRGPNPLGAYSVIVVAFLAALWARKRELFNSTTFCITTAVFAVCALVGVWVSYSRSALVAAILAVGVVLTALYIRKLTPKLWITIGIVIVILSSGLFAFKDSGFVSNVLLHKNPHGGSATVSNTGHILSLQNGWKQLTEQPFGAGIGSTGSASLFGGAPEIIENQFLFVAHESGWLGLGLFLSILLLLMKNLWARRSDWLALGAFASGIGLAAIGVLLPVWVDDTVSIVWWGLAALALGGEYARHKAK